MSTELNLRNLRGTLAQLTREKLVSGFGHDFTAEIRDLDAALNDIAELRKGYVEPASIEQLRNAAEKAVRVIEAGEHDRRDLLAQIMTLTRENRLLRAAAAPATT